MRRVTARVEAVLASLTSDIGERERAAGESLGAGVVLEGVIDCGDRDG